VTLVKNFGTGFPDLKCLTSANGQLYFAASLDPEYEPACLYWGVELWTSDGTLEGTQRVANIHPDPTPDTNGSWPAWITPFKGVLYFTADNGTQGTELWTYTLPGGVMPALRLNAGGAYRTPTGEPFSADGFFSGGSSYRLRTAASIANTVADSLYLTERWGTFSYKLPVENGTYRVILYFAEIYLGNVSPGGVGSRRFNVNVEGVRKLTEYDIFARAGGALRATWEEITVQVTDGILNIDFLKGSANHPKVSAIEVLPTRTAGAAASPAARTAADALATEAWQVRLHPNPVADRLTVQLPFGVAGVQTTAVADVRGNALLQNAHRATGDNELQIATGSLPKGFYLLRLQTDQGSRVVRFVKQ
jgi:ELWxxDGT repeat protein